MSKADIVNSWFTQRLGCSGPLARDTEAYNQVVGALPDLIGQLDSAEATATTDLATVAAAVQASFTPPAPATEKKG